MVAKENYVYLPSTVPGASTSPDYRRLQLPPSWTYSQPVVYETARCIFFHSAWRRQVFFVNDVGRWDALFQSLQLVPELLDRVSARALSRPIQSRDPIAAIRNHRGPRNMIGGIVNLKVTWVHPVELPQRGKRMVIQNGAIGLGLGSTRNCNQGSRAITEETPPYHSSTSAELHSCDDTFWQEEFYRQTPNPDTLPSKL